jgi:diguanylate cyclase (GGDEF)-like protein/PAS domain S-box-containing protein
MNTLSANDFGKRPTPNEPGFYKELLDHLSDGVYFVDLERRVLYWNEGAYRLTGYKAEELLGRSCEDDVLCHIDYAGHRLHGNDCPLTATIATGDRHEASVFLHHKQGRRVPVSVRVQPLRDEMGAIVGAIEIFSDDSARNEELRKTEAMNRLAFLDHLTQLPNRRFMEMSLRTALTEFQEYKNPIGLLLIDLDNFKEINDSFGHSCGDRALQETARMLMGSLRPTDIVGRWGGDEFLAIVRNVDKDVLGKLAERCVAQVSLSSNDERTILVSISAGAALCRPEETAEQLIQRADELMYRCKASGKGRAAAE